jgi:hypothetical protein
MNARGPRGRVEDANARDEVRTVGKIQIMDLLFQTGFDEAIAPLAVSLEWAARIDDEIGCQRLQLHSEFAIAIEDSRAEERARIAPRRAVRGGFLHRTPGHHDLQARFICKQLDEAAAERAIAADNQDFEAASDGISHQAVRGQARCAICGMADGTAAAVFKVNEAGFGRRFVR